MVEKKEHRRLNRKYRRGPTNGCDDDEDCTLSPSAVVVGAKAASLGMGRHVKWEIAVVHWPEMIQ